MTPSRLEYERMDDRRRVIPGLGDCERFGLDLRCGRRCRRAADGGVESRLMLEVATVVARAGGGGLSSDIVVVHESKELHGCTNSDLMVTGIIAAFKLNHRRERKHRAGASAVVRKAELVDGNDDGAKEGKSRAAKCHFFWLS